MEEIAQVDDAPEQKGPPDGLTKEEKVWLTKDDRAIPGFGLAQYRLLADSRKRWAERERLEREMEQQKKNPKPQRRNYLREPIEEWLFNKLDSSLFEPGEMGVNDLLEHLGDNKIMKDRLRIFQEHFAIQRVGIPRNNPASYRWQLKLKGFAGEPWIGEKQLKAFLLVFIRTEGKENQEFILRRLCSYLGISPESVLERTGPESPTPTVQKRPQKATRRPTPAVVMAFIAAAVSAVLVIDRQSPVTFSTPPSFPNPPPASNKIAADEDKPESPPPENPADKTPPYRMESNDTVWGIVQRRYRRILGEQYSRQTVMEGVRRVCQANGIRVPELDIPAGKHDARRLPSGFSLDLNAAVAYAATLQQKE